MLTGRPVKQAKTPLQILQEAYDRLASKGWVGGEGNMASEAVDADGKIVKCGNLSAARWTPFGAIMLAGQPDGMASQSIDALSWLKRYLGKKYGPHISTYQWNSMKGQTLSAVLEDMNEVITDLIDRELARELDHG